MRILTFCILLVLQAQAQTNETQRIQNLLQEWYRNPKTFGVAKLDDNTRSSMILELQKERVSSDVVRQNIVRKHLVELGDRETIQETLEDFHKAASGIQSSKTADILRCATQPWVIPLLEQELFINESAKAVQHEDILISPKSVAASGVIMSILSRSTTFSGKVRDSVAKLPWYDEGKSRDIIRKWYEQNKEAFARKDYAAVKPLQPVPPESTPTSIPKPASATPKQPTMTLAKPSAAAAVRENNPSRWLLGSLIVLAALAGGFILWRAKRRKS
jgi:hypothetical protein